MTKYSWDIKKLIEKRDFFEEKFKMYGELYDLYAEMVENYSKKYQPVKEEIKKVPYLIRLRDEFYEFGKEKISLVSNAIYVTSAYEFKFDRTVHPKMDLSDDDLVLLTRSLFEQIPNRYFLDKFDELTNKDNHLLHIRSNRTLPTNYYGLTFTDPIEHKPYGLISRYHSIQDVISLGHEAFHAIIRELELPFYINPYQGTYGEVEGYFANMLFASLLIKMGYNKENILLFEKIDLITTIDIIRNCFILEQSFSTLNKKGQIDFESVSPILRSKGINFSLTRDTLPELVRQENRDEINGALSYLVSLDLFDSYQNDPEQVLNNLLNLVTIHGKSPRSELPTIGVSFFEDGYQNLDKKCKQLLKTKTTSK
ncbi:MAG: hypothetical protein IJO43_00200 [Bacilli bacterium]|nr:hypothetical protein [Bacilli bacterium]